MQKFISAALVLCFFYSPQHILWGVCFWEVIVVGNCYSDVDDLIFAGEENRPSDR